MMQGISPASQPKKVHTVSYPNMSYCAVENTNAALGQIIGMMEEHDTLDDFYDSLSCDEQCAWRQLVERVEQIQMLNEEADMEC